MDLLHENALKHPQKAAVVMAGGESITYEALDRRATQVAHWLISVGLEPGDGIAMLMENHPGTFELWFGARRAGLYYTPLSIHLTAREVADILDDCSAKLLFTTSKTASIGEQLRTTTATAAADIRHVDVDGPGNDPHSYQAAIRAVPDGVELPRRPLGREFIYSSGTTGKPKGIRRPLVRHEDRFVLPELEQRLRALFELSRDTRYLHPSPLYHSTGRFNIRVIECGGTAVVMDKFDAEAALDAIERYRITHSHWVPTMFIRILALPDEIRRHRNLASMRLTLHSAAPCPDNVKEHMIDW